MEEALEKLEIYRMAHAFAVEVHAMSFKLPSFEAHEEGPQIRRSSKRVSASIVEGFTQRKYKGQFLIYLYRALGSSDETQEHLRLLRDTRSVSDFALCRNLLKSYEHLSGKIFSYICTVEWRHGVPRYLQSAEPPPVPEDSH